MVKITTNERGHERLKEMNPNYISKDWFYEPVLDEYSFSGRGLYSKEYTTVKSKNFNPELILGANRQEYTNQTWIEMLGNLERFDIVKIRKLRENNFFEDFVNIQGGKIHLHKYGTKYFIIEGYDRFCVAKFLGLTIGSVTILDYKMDEENVSNLNWLGEIGIETSLDVEDHWKIRIYDNDVIIKKEMLKPFIAHYENAKVEQSLFGINKIPQRQKFLVSNDEDLHHQGIQKLITEHKKDKKKSAIHLPGKYN